MTDEICCVVPAGDVCGEGAVWHPEERALYWTDINRFLLHCFDPATEAVRTWQFNEPVTTVNLTTDAERLLLVLGSQVGLWSPRTHPEFETIFKLDAWPAMRFNDAAVDPRGSLWAGTMRNNVGTQGENLDVAFSDGELYRIDPNGSAFVWKRGIGISNTVAWSPDGKSFYFGDSIANRIDRFDFDAETGTIADDEPFLVGYAQGVPDGSAMDADGYLWNARPWTGCLIRIAPDGTVERTVKLPVSTPTTCAFGGDDRKTLYITSARSADRLSGSLFALRVDVGGVPDGRFKLI